MIYLDSAATSLEKPAAVSAAVMEAMRTMASPGRGAHEPAMRAAECCYACREKLARLFRAPKAENVVFTFNATHALNLAIGSLVGAGSRVVISGYEHNSVTRPLRALGADVRAIDTPLFDPGALIERAARELPGADAAVFTCVSNVFGYVLPIRELAALCAENGVPLVLDAAQAAGSQTLDFEALGAEFLAMPGHKGLLGPQGTGVLVCKNDAKPVLYGGSGSNSMEQTMPDFLPDRLEAGTHNVCGVAGLSAGVDYVLARGAEEIGCHERELLERFCAALADTPGLRLFYSPDPSAQRSVVSVLPERIGCEAFGEALSRGGVAVRTGLHCAPSAHKTAGTSATGTVRFSFSPFNTPQQIDAAAALCKKILDFA